MRMPTVRILSAVLVMALIGSGLALAQSSEVVIETAFQGETASLSSMAKKVDWKAVRKSLENREIPNKMFKPPGANRTLDKAARDGDPLRQAVHKSQGTSINLLSSFEGTGDDDNADLLGFRIVPPDTNGDVGKDYYIQMNNLVFEIFEKNTGNSALGPLPNNAFFAGTGSLCEATNDGDPIVLYDQGAKRWIFSQFALFDANLDSHQCFAVSQTSDPLGAYYLYDFVISTPMFGGIAGLNDYPKVGVWPTGYFASFNEFEFFPGFGFGYIGASAVAFDRVAMLAGAPAAGVKVFLQFTGAAPGHFSLQPSHWEGHREPPSNAGNIFVQAFDSETWGNPGDPDGYFLWEFTPDYNTPAASTFTTIGLVPSVEFDSNLCNFAPCVPQPAPGEVLDTLAQFTMFRAAYRNFGLQDRNVPHPGNSDNKREAIIVSHVVDADGNDLAGMRWAELRNTGNGFEVHQAGTYAPDNEHRWMGSASIDKLGNIALGYSVSSTSTMPSIRVTGRKKGDPLGEMGQEAECFSGTGVQIDSLNRWGDYSSMSVDPQDGKTFWYTQQYYENTDSFDFKTRVCSFRVK